jgi:hypothetical protein
MFFSYRFSQESIQNTCNNHQESRLVNRLKRLAKSQFLGIKWVHIIRQHPSAAINPIPSILCLKQSHCPAPEYVNYLWVSESQAKEYKCQMEKVMWGQNNTWRRWNSDLKRSISVSDADSFALASMSPWKTDCKILRSPYLRTTWLLNPSPSILHLIIPEETSSQ